MVRHRVETQAKVGDRVGRRFRWLWLLIAALTIGAMVVIAIRSTERPRYITVRDAVAAGDIKDVMYHADQGTDLFYVDEAGYTLLHTAAGSGRAEIAAYLLSRGLDPDMRDPQLTISNYTALHIAAREDHAEVVSVLLAAGAEVNARDARGRTPLHMAAMNDGAEAARVLLEHSAGPSIRDDAEMSPLGLAVRWEKERVGRVLIQYGAVR